MKAIVLGFLLVTLLSIEFCGAMAGRVSEHVSKTQLLRDSVFAIDAPWVNDHGSLFHTSGTAFVVSSEGYLLTAYHVIEKWKKQRETDRIAYNIVSTTNVSF